jgi:hypothetical protein
MSRYYDDRPELADTINAMKRTINRLDDKLIDIEIRLAEIIKRVEKLEK